MIYFMKCIAYVVAIWGIFLVIAALVCGCGELPDIFGPDDQPVYPEATCEELCAKAIVMDCAIAQGAPGKDLVFGTSDDIPCVPACKVAFGPGTWYDLGCMILVDECGEMDTCGE